MAKDKALRVPPQTLETEKALLGALMIRPEGMNESSDVISADAFYAEKHRIIYRGMLLLYQKKSPAISSRCAIRGRTGASRNGSEAPATSPTWRPRPPPRATRATTPPR